MRLHRLRLQAFGPFALAQSIDFEPLGAGGLFLLDGPTGAGKSTVLDAITFALYGPGDHAGDGRLHSHFASADIEPEVELEFSLRGVRHRVTRAPEYRRPKRRGDGTTIQAARVHLQRWDNGRWVSRSSNKAEVGEMLGEEIGLTRDQFTQVVLLPQGEFMKFLRASDDDRRVLLTRLFGTQLYDRITEELDRRRQLASKDVEDSDRQVRACVAAAAEAAGLDAQLRAELAGLDPSGRDDRLRCLAARLAADLDAAVASCEWAVATRDEQRLRADAAGAAAERMERLNTAQAALAGHEASRGEHDRRAASLAAADRAEPVRPLLEALAEAKHAVTQARGALARVAPDASIEWRRGAGVAELSELAAARSTRAAELQHLVLRELEQPVLRQRVEHATSLTGTAAAAVEALSWRRREIPRDAARADAAVLTAQQHAASLEPLRERCAATSRRFGAASELAVLEPILAEAIDRQRTGFGRYEAAVDEHHRRIDARLANIAAELAAQLRDGEPCAVCGSAEHPAPAVASPGAVTADDVAEAERTRAAAERERDRLADERAVHEHRRAMLIVQADGGEVAALAAEVTAVTVAVTSAERGAAALTGLKAARTELEIESARLEDELAIALDTLSAASTELALAQRAFDELTSQLGDASDGHASVAACQRQLRAEAAYASHLATAVGALARSLVNCDEARERAAREAADRGFADLSAASAAALPREEHQASGRQVLDWRADADRLRGALEEAQRGAPDAADLDDLRARAEQARTGLAEAEDEARAAAVAADRARLRVSRFADACAEVTTGQLEYDELATATAPVVYLAKLARGVSGQRRVALTTYVLRQWFEQVVQAANLRLCGMSSGRYELVRVDEGASRSERVGLTLQVLDRHTGEQRSTRSLSGGETFYTSLALALGLADIVRAEAGGVDLDTLFIDEGFGTLDSDTLDQVMAVIDELRERGRTVGIVSHVSELKDRIAERIEVRRLPDGSSTLRVVA